MANPLKVSLTIEAFNKALNPIKRTRQAIKKLSEQSEQLKTYDKVKQQFNQANKTLREARGQVRQLHQERGVDGKVTQAWRQKMQQANAQVKAAKLATQSQREALKTLSDGLRSAGLRTSNLGQQQNKIEQRIKRATLALKLQTGAAKMLSTTWRAFKLPFSALGKLSIYGGLIGSTFSMVRNKLSQLINPFVGVAAKLEDFEGTMQALNGTGKQSIEWIDSFARKNPVVPITQLASAFEDLTLAGMPVEKTLQSVIDYNAGIGKSAENAGAIIDVLTKDWTRQRVGAGSSNALQRLGVPVFDLLSRWTERTQPEGQQLSSKQFADMAKQGKLGRDAIKALMEQMQYEQEGAAAKTQTSWNGLMDEISARWQLFQKDLMDHGVFDALKEQLQKLSGWLSEQAENGNMKRWAKDVSDNLVPAIKRANEALDMTLSTLKGIKTAWDYSFGGLGKGIGWLAFKTVDEIKGDGKKRRWQELENRMAEQQLKKRQQTLGDALPTVADKQKHNEAAKEQNKTPLAKVQFSFDSTGMPRFDLKTDDGLLLESNVGYSLAGAY